MLRPLNPEASATVRDRLVQAIAGLGSADAAAEWVRTALPAKNTLTESDARLVQLAFELRLSALEGDAERRQDDPQSPLMSQNELGGTEPSGASSAASEPCSSAGDRVERHSGRTRSRGIDKSVLSISEVRRYRDKAHLKFVASRPCLVCGRKPSDPHHLRFAQVRALGRKVSDEFTVPLCRTHHRELHRARNEAGWWAKLGIDAIAIARKLWNETRSAGFPAPSANVQPAAAGAPSASAVTKARAGRRTRKEATPGTSDAAPNRA
jgi:hypothetical protein